MKKIIFFLFFIVLNLFGQEESQSQSIELPDFVITGKESISIPKMQKAYPDFIPLLSSDFFTPQYPSEEITPIQLPNVENELVSLGSYKQSSKALLKFSAGLETFPNGEFYYTDWKDNFSYNAHLFGKNELEYVNKAGLSIAGINAGAKYFVDHASEFLPGLEIDLSGNYFYESFNFYGSTSPDLNRVTNNGFAKLSFNYFSDPFKNFGFSITDDYYKQKDDEIEENIVGTDAFLTFRYSDLNFKIMGAYKNQTISSLNQSFENQYYFQTQATAGFKIYDVLNIRAGAFLSESEGNTFFAPVAYGSMKFNKNISFYGEFAPNTEFKTLKDFRNNNRYYQFNNFVNMFVENKFNLKFALKYEYEKYFEISGGVGYINSDNNYYFEDNLDEGFFTIQKQDIENSYTFINFLFRKGPLGEFYGELKLQKITGQNDNHIPYKSTITSNLKYSYDWENGFGINFGLIYFNKAYTNIENAETIPETINANTSLYYELFRNFKITLSLENLFNNDHYYYRNYEAKPFDILAGFEFRW